jgi:hypothetical protein
MLSTVFVIAMTVLLECKMRFFSLKFGTYTYILICVQSAELECAKPDHSELDRAEPNQGLHHQIIIWDLRSSVLLRSVQWSFLADISGQPIGTIFKGQ